MKLSIVLATIVLASTFAFASVNILPMKPKSGQEITIEYTPTDADMKWAEDSKNLHAVFFGFTWEAEAPVATEIPLKKSGKKWSGAFAPASDVLFGMIKVGDGNKYDTNKELFWNVLIHGEKGYAVKGAHMKAGMACFGMLPQECKRKQDLNEAEDEFVEEAKLYPSNIAAQVNVVMLGKNNQTMDEADANARLQQIVDGNKTANSVLDAIALSQACQQLGRGEDAQRIMQEASIKFPGSKIEEQAKLESLSKAPTAAAFVTAIKLHLTNYPNTFAKQNLLDAAIQTASRGGEFRGLIEFLENTPGIPAITYYQAVNYIGAQDSLRGESLHLIEKGLATAKDDKVRPRHIGQSEWKEQQRIAQSLLWFVKGAIQGEMGEGKESLASLEKSIELGGDQTDKAAYEVYIAGLIKTDNKSKALDVATAAIGKGAATQGVIDNYRMLKMSAGSDSAKVESSLADLKKKGRIQQAMKLEGEMLNQGMVDGTFTKMDGTPVKISDWKGKVVLLDYWATWCGPCRKSFPSMQKVYDTYKNNPNVVFAIVNVWERSEDRVKTINDFLSQNTSLTFPIYMDKDDSVVSKFGVTGIPTKFFLGKDGRIQFKEVGFLPEEQFIEETTNRIEVLLAQ